MIYYKTLEEIKRIKASADILGRAHAEVAKNIRPGVTTKQLDKLAEQFIRDNGAYPSFLNYSGFPASLCISVNDVVVHGIPGPYELKEGDIISVDCGVLKDGFHSDSAYTHCVGEVDPETKKLLEVTLQSLYAGIEQVKVGNTIGDVGYAVQSLVEKNGFTVVRDLVGHGIGRMLHEDPQVPNYGRKGSGPKIKDGLVIAIEPMVNMGTFKVVRMRDGWTIKTKDNKPSAHFEHTVAVVDGKAEILTTFEYLLEVINK